MAWTRSSRVWHADGVLTAFVDETLVVLRPETGEYAGLDATAARIWQVTELPTTFGTVVDLLAAEHDATRAAVAPDVAQCLERLRRQGLVHHGGSTAAP